MTITRKTPSEIKQVVQRLDRLTAKKAVLTAKLADVDKDLKAAGERMQALVAAVTS